MTATTELANVLGTRALARVGSVGSGNDFLVESLNRGTATNGYTVQFTSSGTVTAGSEAVKAFGTTITVDIDSGSSTAAQVVDALNNDATFAAVRAGSIRTIRKGINRLHLRPRRLRAAAAASSSTKRAGCESRTAGTRTQSIRVRPTRSKIC